MRKHWSSVTKRNTGFLAALLLSWILAGCAGQASREDLDGQNAIGAVESPVTEVARQKAGEAAVEEPAPVPAPEMPEVSLPQPVAAADEPASEAVENPVVAASKPVTELAESIETEQLAQPAAPEKTADEPRDESPVGSQVGTRVETHPKAVAGTEQTTPAPESEPPSAPPAPAMDLDRLEDRLRHTKALGLFTKLELKGQVEDLVDELEIYHQSKSNLSLEQLEEHFNLLVMKLLLLLQDDDPQLHHEIASARPTLWIALSDPVQFSTIKGP